MSSGLDGRRVRPCEGAAGYAPMSPRPGKILAARKLCRCFSQSGSAVLNARKTPRSGERGVFASAGSIAVRLAAAGPDQRVGLGVFVVEEVGVDRSVEAWVVQLDREIIAAFAGPLRPRGPNLRATHVDPVARRVVVGPICLGDDADALGLDAQGNDLALEFLAGLLE